MERKMGDNDSTFPQKRTKKFIFLGVLSLLLVLLASHFIWKNSGSNEWVLVKNENGIKVWTLKTPGYCLKQVKATMTTKSRLSPILFFLESDATVDDFEIKDWKMFDKIEDSSIYIAYYSYKVDMPFPIGTREYVIQMSHSQDIDTKIVEVNVLATPAKTHPTQNCERVKCLHNIWRLTPLENEEVEIEVKVDMDLGGYIPYFIINAALPDAWSNSLNTMREMLKDKKYENVKINYITEINNNDIN